MVGTGRAVKMFGVPALDAQHLLRGGGLGDAFLET
jgi:hypothetical protein